MSLPVLLILQVLVRPLGLHALHQLVDASLRAVGRWQYRPPEAHTEILRRTLAVVAPIWNILLALLSVGLILEIWGVAVRWLLTSPLALQFFVHVLIIGLIVGLVIGVLQASSVLTEYLLHVHATRWNGSRQFGA